MQDDRLTQVTNLLDVAGDGFDDASYGSSSRSTSVSGASDGVQTGFIDPESLLSHNDSGKSQISTATKHKLLGISTLAGLGSLAYLATRLFGSAKTLLLVTGTLNNKFVSYTESADSAGVFKLDPQSTARIQLFGGNITEFSVVDSPDPEFKCTAVNGTMLECNVPKDQQSLTLSIAGVEQKVFGYVEPRSISCFTYKPADGWITRQPLMSNSTKEVVYVIENTTSHWGASAFPVRASNGSYITSVYVGVEPVTVSMEGGYADPTLPLSVYSLEKEITFIPVKPTVSPRTPPERFAGCTSVVDARFGGDAYYKKNISKFGESVSVWGPVYGYASVSYSDSPECGYVGECGNMHPHPEFDQEVAGRLWADCSSSREIDIPQGGSADCTFFAGSVNAVDNRTYTQQANATPS